MNTTTSIKHQHKVRSSGLKCFLQELAFDATHKLLHFLILTHKNRGMWELGPKYSLDLNSLVI